MKTRNDGSKLKGDLLNLFTKINKVIAGLIDYYYGAATPFEEKQKIAMLMETEVFKRDRDLQHLLQQNPINEKEIEKALNGLSFLYFNKKGLKSFPEINQNIKIMNILDHQESLIYQPPRFIPENELVLTGFGAEIDEDAPIGQILQELTEEIEGRLKTNASLNENPLICRERDHSEYSIHSTHIALKNLCLEMNKRQTKIKEKEHVEPIGQSVPISCFNLSKSHAFLSQKKACQSQPKMQITPVFNFLKRAHKNIYTDEMQTVNPGAALKKCGLKYIFDNKNIIVNKENTNIQFQIDEKGLFITHVTDEETFGAMFAVFKTVYGKTASPFVKLYDQSIKIEVRIAFETVFGQGQILELENNNIFSQNL